MRSWRPRDAATSDTTPAILEHTEEYVSDHRPRERRRTSRAVLNSHLLRKARVGSHVTGRLEAVDVHSLRYDAISVRLFCAWTFLQCFFYGALPSFRLNLGAHITPDKLALVAMLLAVAARFAGAYPSVAPGSRVAGAV